MGILDVKLRDIALAFMIVPLLKPEGLDILLPTVSTVVYDYGVYVDAIVIVMWFLYSLFRSKHAISPVLLATLAFIGFDFLITFYNGGSIYSFASSWFRVVLIGLLVECCVGSLDKLLRLMMTYLAVLVLINLVLVGLYPHGMYVSEIYFGFDTNWLLGYKSSLQYYVIPLITIALYYAIKRHELRRFILILVLCHVETILVRNVMLLAGLAIFDLIAFVSISGKSTPRYSLQIGIVAISNALLLAFGEVMMRGEGFLSWLVGSIFGKSETMFTRMQIWASAFDSLPGHYAFGYGVLTNEQRIQLIGNHAHVHNQVLQVLFESGIFGLILFVVIFLILYKSFSNSHNYVSVVFGGMLFVLFMMSLVEIFTRGPGSFIWGLIFISYHLAFQNDSATQRISDEISGS